MKKIYWRPQGMSVTALILICVFSVAGLVTVEIFQSKVKQPYYQEKIEAARLASEAMDFLKREKLRRGFVIDEETDPLQSGLIGQRMSPVTSDTGDIEAKQMSINPNFAAVIVELLKKLEVQEGDKVAVGYTGSFPALNISVSAAIQTLKLKPVIISTASSSQWGANDPDFLWIYMERLLYEKNILSSRSVAASIGGKSDMGKEMTAQGLKLLTTAIEKNGLIPIRHTTIQENVDHRMQIYYKDGAPKLFINVGGSIASVGKKLYRKQLRPGIILSEPQSVEKTNSVMKKFLEEGIPIIHIENVKDIARLYGLNLHHLIMPAIGDGKIYIRKEYDPVLAGIILAGILLTIYIFAKTDLGFRIFQPTSHKEEPGPPEPMV